jgi:hypothetical protein
VKSLRVAVSSWYRSRLQYLVSHRGYLAFLVTLFAGLGLAGNLVARFDPEGFARRKREAEALAAEQDAFASEPFELQLSISSAGFATGRHMAKTGQAKPTPEQLDELALRSTNALGIERHGGYRQAWKRAFWLGWRKRD